LSPWPWDLQALFTGTLEESSERDRLPVKAAGRKHVQVLATLRFQPLKNWGANVVI
jgi:hypothetical protein